MIFFETFSAILDEKLIQLVELWETNIIGDSYTWFIQKIERDRMNNKIQILQF